MARLADRFVHRAFRTGMAALLMKDVVVIPLVHRPIFEIVKATLANYKLPNSTISSFWNARQWYFK